MVWWSSRHGSGAARPQPASGQRAVVGEQVRKPFPLKFPSSGTFENGRREPLAADRQSDLARIGRGRATLPEPRATQGQDLFLPQTSFFSLSQTDPDQS